MRSIRTLSRIIRQPSNSITWSQWPPLITSTRWPTFSNFGALSVDLAAPGDYILSTYLLYEDQYDDYAWSSGTSMAAPHVAAAAGLILSLQPDWTYQQVKVRLLDSARPLAALAGKSR